MKFYNCKGCNEILISRCEIKDVKCGHENEENNEMVELIPNSTEASQEKHIPIIRKIGNLVTVTVGSVIHPSVEIHYIDFILLETDKGSYYKKVEFGKDPIIDFLVHNEEKVLRAYTYCNIHGLWVSEEVNEITNL